MAAQLDNRGRQALARQRARMDRLNRQLRDLLQRRARLAVEIASWKAARGLGVADPARERAMLDAMLRTSGEGFDRATLRRLLRAILAASRAVAERGAARASDHSGANRAARRRRRT